LSEDGLPILSVPYLRHPSGDERYEVTPKTRCATEDDVLVIVKGANTGEVFKGVDGILTPSIAAIKCTNESVITPHYMYYLLKGYEKSLMSIAKGATIKSIDAKMIPDFKCLVPPVEEQIQISEYLDTMIGKIDCIIETLQSEGGTFSKLRQALIENIVRGIWRIPNK
jgi:type I restriction enzyme S subunit